MAIAYPKKRPAVPPVPENEWEVISDDSEWEVIGAAPKKDRAEGVLPGTFAGDLLRGVGKTVAESFSPKTNPALERAIGLGEAGMAAASGMGAGMVGLAGGAIQAAPHLLGGSGRGFEVAERAMGDIAAPLTYQPRTQSGRDFAQVANAPFSAIGQGADALARAVSDNPNTQAGVRLAAELGLNIFLGKVGHRIIKGRGPGELPAGFLDDAAAGVTEAPGAVPEAAGKAVRPNPVADAMSGLKDVVVNEAVNPSPDNVPRIPAQRPVLAKPRTGKKPTPVVEREPPPQLRLFDGDQISEGVDVSVIHDTVHTPAQPKPGGMMSAGILPIPDRLGRGRVAPKARPSLGPEPKMPEMVEPPPDAAVPLKTVRSKGSSQATVFEHEIRPFAEGKMPGDLPKSALTRYIANPYRWMWYYQPIYRGLMETYNKRMAGAAKLKQHIRQEVNTWRQDVGTEGLVNIGRHLIAGQKKGPKILKIMGEDTKMRPMTPPETAIFNRIRSALDAKFVEINNARVLNGEQPLKRVDNYFTFMTDMAALDEMGINMALAPMKQIETALAYARTPKRGVKRVFLPYALKRTSGAVPVKLNAAEVFETYMARANDFLAVTPVVAKGRALLGSHLLEKRLTGKTLKNGTQQAKNIYYSIDQTHPFLARDVHAWLNHIAGKGLDAGAHDGVRLIRNWSGRLARGLSRSVLGGAVRTALVQFASLKNTTNLVGYPATAEGIAKAMFSKEARRQAAVESDVLYLRKHYSYDAVVYDAMQWKGVRNIGAGLWRLFNEAAFKPLQAIDYTMAEITYLAAKKYGTRTLKLGEREAVRFADHITLNSQASGLPGHTAPIQWSQAGKLASVFQTFTINEFNHILTDVFGWHNLEFKGKSGFDRTIMAARLLTSTTLFNILYEDLIGVRSPFPTPIREAVRSYEKNKDPVKAAIVGAKDLTETVPIIGGVMRWSTPNRLALPAAAAPFGNMIQAFNKYAPSVWAYIKGEDAGKPPKFNPRDLEFVGQLLGITGTTQVMKTISRLREGYAPMAAILGARMDVQRKGDGKGGKKKPTPPPQYFNPRW